MKYRHAFHAGNFADVHKHVTLVALFESLLPEPWPLPVHAALAVIYLLTVAVGAWLVGAPERPVAKRSTSRRRRFLDHRHAGNGREEDAWHFTNGDFFPQCGKKSPTICS